LEKNNLTEKEFLNYFSYFWQQHNLPKFPHTWRQVHIIVTSMSHISTMIMLNNIHYRLWKHCTYEQCTLGFGYISICNTKNNSYVQKFSSCSFYEYQLLIWINEKTYEL
jgi:hypothetical protein